MYKKIIEKMPRDKDLPFRAFILGIYNKFLKGTFYDHLNYHFYEEYNNCRERISILERAPCVRYRLAKLVVDDSVSLLFGDGHFPTFEVEDDEEMRQVLENIKDATHLKNVMIKAATMGSIGSVAIVMQIVDNYLHFKPLSTIYLTPTFSEAKPDQLVSVRELYKVKGADLFAHGYDDVVDDLDLHAMYWMERVWDESREIRYVPYPVINLENNPVKKSIDETRSKTHELGFVPIVWIKNLESESDIDGSCTFEPAMDNIIEIEYQLSQVGRALRYSSDPVLLIKDSSPNDGSQPMIKTPAAGLKIDSDGDAKYLEINGQSSQAVLKYVEELRKMALENIHGNRANPDKLSTAQSGRAIELLYQPLVWLADRLRISYGKALIQLLNMVVSASYKYKINLSQTLVSQDEGKFVSNLNKNAQISLRWPSWFGTTTYDKLELANTLKTLGDSGHISQETAVKTIAVDYGIPDPSEEVAQINKEIAERNAELNPQTKEVINI